MYNKRLETFIKIADLGSFSKAAESLYISPTAVIKQIIFWNKNSEFVFLKELIKVSVLPMPEKAYMPMQNI